MQPKTVEGKLGIGLVGVGRHGSRYARYLKDGMPDAELVAVSRRNPLAGFPDAGVRVYGDYRAMIADPLVDAVVVVTPPSLCPDVCLAAVREGKPILVEKPLALTGREARAMVESAARAGAMLMTAQTMRFDSTVLKARELLEDIGTLKRAILTSHIETKPNMMADISKQAWIPVGAVLELGIHLFDLIRFFTQEEVVELRCTTDPRPPERPDMKAWADLRTSGGTLCHLDIARIESQRIGRMEWIGSDGMVRADWVSGSVARSRGPGEPDEWKIEAQPTIPATLQAFVRSIRTGQPPPITGLDGCRAVELADACYRSASNGGLWLSVTAVD